jgi:hypothetical protein
MRRGLLRRSTPYARAGDRTRAEVISLPARVPPAGGDAPPVRIFVGTESGQHRAERVLVWSIEQVRDPARSYEIHLLRDLAGFDRRRWLTGFTNYRFAIPALAGARGRAIYNDVDQIYLADPAALFDLDLEGHGYLSIRPSDTSVMLIECERMARVWTPELVRTSRRKAIEARAAAMPGLWGALAPEWNARDEEYAAGHTRVLHYTTIHTQPWQPCPERFVYQPNPVGEVWLALERSADRAGYRLFGAERPSAAFRERCERLRAAPAAATPEPPELAEALAEARAQHVLAVSLGSAARAEAARGEPPGRTTAAWDPAFPALAKAPAEGFDAVVCHDALERVPDEDAPWLVEALFRHARRLVVASVSTHPAPLRLAGGSRLDLQSRSEAFWLALFEAAAAAHPGVRWRLVLRAPAHLGRVSVRLREGGPPPGRAPRVWVLTDDKAGHTTQSLGLAEALGWPYERKTLRFTRLALLSNGLLGASRVGLDPRGAAQLAPPWPDLVIATGRRTAPVARWIERRSHGRARLVQLGRKGGDVADRFDLSVTCSHFRLPPHPRRVETIVPLAAVSREKLAEEAARHAALFEGAAHPRVALLVGGSSALHRLDAETAARLGRELHAFTSAAGGSLLAITSPRTGAAATEALARSLGDGALLHRWRRADPANPYLAFLGAADAIVVTGDSESMLAEAVGTGKPVYVFPVPERPDGPRRRLAKWVLARAAARPRKSAKGTVRPQQGLEYASARLLESALVRPPRDLARLHRELARRGLARAFGAPLDLAAPPPLRELEEVVARVRSLLGTGCDPALGNPPC